MEAPAPLPGYPEPEGGCDVRRNFIVLQTTTTDVNFKSSILIDCDQKRSLCSLKNWSLGSTIKSQIHL